MSSRCVLRSFFIFVMILQASACTTNANHAEGAGVGVVVGSVVALVSGVEPVSGAILGIIVGVLAGEAVDQRQQALEQREAEILSEIAAASNKRGEITVAAEYVDAVVMGRMYLSKIKSERDDARSRLRIIKSILGSEKTAIDDMLSKAEDTLQGIDGDDRAAQTARKHLRDYVKELRDGQERARVTINKIDRVL